MQLEHILQAHGLVGRGGQSKSLPTIQNFRGSSNDLGTEIILNWDNPTVIEFQKVQIFMSDTDISNLTYNELILNGNMIVNAKVTTHTVTGLKHNDTRYFKAFGLFNVLGEEKVSTGVSLTVTTKDIVPPDTITNFSAEEDDKQVTLTWTNPSSSDFSKVKILYKQGSYPTSPNDGMVAYEGSGNTVIVTGLTNDVEYYFRAFTYDTSGNINDNTNNQQIVAIPSGADDKSGSPGNKKLIAGDMQEGFFGEVSSSELITGDALASLVGISQGTSQHSTAGWLKFAWKGKILFIAKKPIRKSISWDAINTAKCVYGDSGDKRVEIGGLTYKVRLMRALEPSNNPKTVASDDRGTINHYSEWNRLMCQIHEQAIDKSWDYPNNIEDDIGILRHNLGSGSQGMYSDSDLLLRGLGTGMASWCQEMGKSTSDRLLRGWYGVSYSETWSSSSDNSAYGWRPVLELVE